MTLKPNQRDFLTRHGLSTASAEDDEDFPLDGVETAAAQEDARPDSGRAAFEAAIRHIEDLAHEIDGQSDGWKAENQRLDKTLADCCRVVERYVERASELPDFDEIVGRARDATELAGSTRESLRHSLSSGFYVFVRGCPSGGTVNVQVNSGMGILGLIARIERASGEPFDVDESYLTIGNKRLNPSKDVDDYDGLTRHATLEWIGPTRGGIGESEDPATPPDGSQVTARPWDEQGPHDFELPVQDLVSDGRPWSNIVDKLEAVREDRCFAAEVDELDDFRIYRLIGERPDLKEEIWKWSGLRQRIFGILLALPGDELRKTSEFTLSDREFLTFARSSDDARERLSQVCEKRLVALEDPNPEEELNPDPDP